MSVAFLLRACDRQIHEMDAMTAPAISDGTSIGSAAFSDGDATEAARSGAFYW